MINQERRSSMGETKKKKIYSKEFKMQVVQRVLEDGQGIRETAREFNNAHCMVQKWMRLYLEKGESGLKSARAKRYYEGEKPHPPRKPKPKPNAKGYIESELPEAVRNELRHLRMENAYLKNKHLSSKAGTPTAAEKQRLSSN